MRTPSFFAAIALAAGIAGTGAFVPAAMADDDARGPASAGGFLTVAEIYQRLAGDGYSRIEEIEFDDGKYEVEAIDSQGREVELDLDPRTGRILKVDYDD